MSLLRAQEAYCWGTHQGAELDLFVMHKGQRLGFEIKLSESPSIMKSMRIAIQDLSLARLFVVYPGAASFQLDEKIEAVGVARMACRVLRPVATNSSRGSEA